MRGIFLSAALLAAAPFASAGELYEEYLHGILFATPHTLEYAAGDKKAVFFETTYDIDTFVADPARGIYGISASTSTASLFYIFDIRALYGAVLSRKDIVSGKGVFRFEDLTLSPDGRYLRRKNGSIEHYEISYFDTLKKIKKKSPPPDSVWTAGTWARETFGSVVFRGQDEYSVRLSSAVADILLFPDRDESLLLYYDGRPPGLFSLKPFEPIREFPVAVETALKRGRTIDWCPDAECLLLTDARGAYLYYPATDRRWDIPGLLGACDNLHSQHVLRRAMLVECRDLGRFTAVLMETSGEDGLPPRFERLPVPASSRVYYQWKDRTRDPWLTADFNQILTDSRRADARRDAESALAAKELARLKADEERRLREEREDERKRQAANPLLGQLAAVFHVGLLGGVVLHLRRKKPSAVEGLK